MSNLEKRDVRAPTPYASIIESFTNLGAEIDPTPVALLAELVEAVTRVVDGACCANIVAAKGGRVEVLVPSNAVVAKVDPVHDGRAHARAGLRAVMSHRLDLQDGTTTHLCIFSRSSDEFDGATIAVARLLATHGAVVVRAARARQEALDLRRALRSNRLIGTAVGILMARHGLDSQQAFAMLSTASQGANRKVVDLAAELVHEGRLSVGRPGFDNDTGASNGG